MTIHQFTDRMNALGHDRIPFLFIVDFELSRPLLLPLSEIDPAAILFDINGVTNAPGAAHHHTVSLRKMPDTFADYQRKFDEVYARLAYGDSFLTNLTLRTEIGIMDSLRDMFSFTQARYKLLLEEEFLVFSPERFVEIGDGVIRSFPMKGTIDASVPDASNTLLHDQKELCEHVTIVDLIRNDLSQVAHQVTVEKFRYVEEVKTHDKTLLQVSSMITGRLAPDYRSRLGEILISLLPAGSVSGAPKAKTLQIIHDVEKEPRGYYTGVCGIFNGQSLDSGVMIRFIERAGDKYYYRSGGGITTQSMAAMEYQEVIDKIYVPVA